ncbi:MAG: hypothetical protein PHU85_20190 [Phycisphaerae bacterium]|nr:hypothetical protein [Phycisphaerae bacterium]
MSRRFTSSLVDDVVAMLVQHFGPDRVLAALNRASHTGVEAKAAESQLPLASRTINRPHTGIVITLERLREKDVEKHRLLTDFYRRLKSRVVLPESQDMRHFALMIGLKEISGKSREDMIPQLMRFLVDQPTDRLKDDVAGAANISEEQRQQGFSLLTDKLLRNK